MSPPCPLIPSMSPDPHHVLRSPACPQIPIMSPDPHHVLRSPACPQIHSMSPDPQMIPVISCPVLHSKMQARCEPVSYPKSLQRLILFCEISLLYLCFQQSSLFFCGQHFISFNPYCFQSCLTDFLLYCNILFVS